MIVRLHYPVGWTKFVARGLGQTGGDFVSALASAIQQVEGYYPPGSVVGGASYPQGSLAYRNNNPGNLRPGSLAVGATGSNGGYAVFPDFQTGWNALLGLIQSPAYWSLTLVQFFSQYAPSADNNNPAAYAATVAASLGVDPNTPISQLASGGGAGPAGNGDSGDGDGSDSAGSSGIAPGSDLGSQISQAFSAIPTWLLAGAGIVLGLALVL